jgi:hypothetical protein
VVVHVAAVSVVVVHAAAVGNGSLRPLFRPPTHQLIRVVWARGSIFMSQSVERVSEDLNVLRGSEDLNFTQSLRCNSSSMPSGSRGCLVHPCVGAYWNQRLRDSKTSEGALNRIVSNISSATASALEIDLVSTTTRVPSIVWVLS